MSLNDNEYPDRGPEGQKWGEDNSLGGYKRSPYGLYETPGTMNSSWGYRYYDQNWISPETIVKRRKKLNSMGVNYLLNVGPDGLGRIPSFSSEALLKAAEQF